MEERATIYDGMHRRSSKNTETLWIAFYRVHFLVSFKGVTVTQRQDMIEIF
jgi:hypothetical protein